MVCVYLCIYLLLLIMSCFILTQFLSGGNFRAFQPPSTGSFHHGLTLCGCILRPTIWKYRYTVQNIYCNFDTCDTVYYHYYHTSLRKSRVCWRESNTVNVTQRLFFLLHRHRKPLQYARDPLQNFIVFTTFISIKIKQT